MTIFQEHRAHKKQYELTISVYFEDGTRQAVTVPSEENGTLYQPREMSNGLKMLADILAAPTIYQNLNFGPALS